MMDAERGFLPLSLKLGNTKSVCRKCYIHPAILDAYMEGATIGLRRARASQRRDGTHVLSAEEAAVVRMLDPRATGRFAVLVFGRGISAEPPLSGLGQNAYRSRQ